MPLQVISSESPPKRTSRPFAVKFRLNTSMCRFMSIQVRLSREFSRTFVAAVPPFMGFEVCAIIQKALAGKINVADNLL